MSSSLSLSCQPAPPRYPFVNVYFPLKVFLLDSKKVLKSGLSIPLAAELLVESSSGGSIPLPVPVPLSQSSGRPLLELDPPVPHLSPDGSASFRVRILRTCSEFENRNFFLRVFVPASAVASFPAPLNIAPQPFNSKPMTVVRAKIRITEQPPSTWYKDEGGRDKCISLSGCVEDGTGAAAALPGGREIPLRVALCYEGPEYSEVKNQSILKLASEGSPRVERSGKFTLKLRIEEVSKNHQKQGFTIRIAPEQAQHGDIAPDISNAIQVLSKRNKRRKKDSAAVSSSSLPPMRRLQSDDSTMGVPVTVNIASAINGLPSQGNSQSLLASGSLPLSSSVVPFSSLVHSVIGWCQLAVKSFQAIEWQHVAFEVSEDGSVNLHRPIFRCPSCWQYRDTLRQSAHASGCALHRCVQQYSSSLSLHLQELAQIASDPAAAHDQRQNKKRKLEADERTDEEADNGGGTEADGEDEDGDEELDGDDDGEEDGAADRPGQVLPVPSLPAYNPTMFTSPSQGHSALHNFSSMSVMHSLASSSALPSGPPSLLPDLSLNFNYDGLEDAMLLPPTQPPLLAQPSILGSSLALPSGAAFLHFDEHLVSAIHLLSTEWGFPAFSQSDELLGFYFESPLGSSEAIQFQPISQIPANALADRGKELTDAFKQAKLSKPGSILLKSEYITIEKLKEQAILTHYAQQTGGYLD